MRRSTFWRYIMLLGVPVVFAILHIQNIATWRWGMDYAVGYITAFIVGLSADLWFFLGLQNGKPQDTKKRVKEAFQPD